VIERLSRSGFGGLLGSAKNSALVAQGHRRLISVAEPGQLQHVFRAAAGLEAQRQG
jgi:hypothetical protein